MTRVHHQTVREGATMSSIGERLREAILEFGPRPRGRATGQGSIRSFQEAMEAKDLSGFGVSRQMIHRYLKDESAPPEAFLRAAAEVLDPVSCAWLATGKGERTRSREKARVVASTLTAIASGSFAGEGTIDIPADGPFSLENVGTPDRVLADALAPVLRGLGVDGGDAAPTWAGALVTLWQELTATGLEGMGKDYERIAQALRAPLDAFGVDVAEMREAGRLDAYVFGMVPGLLVLAAEARRQVEGQHSPTK